MRCGRRVGCRNREACERDRQRAPAVRIVDGHAGERLGAVQADGEHVDDGSRAISRGTAPDLRGSRIGDQVDREAGAGPPLAEVATNHQVGARRRAVTEGQRHVADYSLVVPQVGVGRVEQQVGTGRICPGTAEAHALAVAQRDQVAGAQVERMAAEGRNARRRPNVNPAQRDGRLGAQGHRGVLCVAHDARRGDQTGRENETFGGLGEDGGVHVAYCKLRTLRTRWQYLAARNGAEKPR